MNTDYLDIPRPNEYGLGNTILKCLRGYRPQGKTKYYLPEQFYSCLKYEDNLSGEITKITNYLETGRKTIIVLSNDNSIKLTNNIGEIQSINNYDFTVKAVQFPDYPALTMQIKQPNPGHVGEYGYFLHDIFQNVLTGDIIQGMDYYFESIMTMSDNFFEDIKFLASNLPFGWKSISVILMPSNGSKSDHLRLTNHSGQMVTGENKHQIRGIVFNLLPICKFVNVEDLEIKDNKQFLGKFKSLLPPNAGLGLSFIKTEDWLPNKLTHISVSL